MQRGSYNLHMILALFALILVVIAGAAAVPVMARRLGRIVERDVGVLGASVLTLGLGGINLVALLWFTAGGEVGAATLPFGAAPMAAGLLGLRVVRGRLAGTRRTVSLLAAAALALAEHLRALSVPMYTRIQEDRVVVDLRTLLGETLP